MEQYSFDSFHNKLMRLTGHPLLIGQAVELRGESDQFSVHFTSSKSPGSNR